MIYGSMDPGGSLPGIEEETEDFQADIEEGGENVFRDMEEDIDTDPGELKESNEEPSGGKLKSLFGVVLKDWKRMVAEKKQDVLVYANLSGKRKKSDYQTEFSFAVTNYSSTDDMAAEKRDTSEGKAKSYKTVSAYALHRGARFRGLSLNKRR